MYAIDIQNVSKSYKMYQKPIDRLKETLWRKPFHKVFQALTDVSFRVPCGETVGIIGDNGMGKSTLLKIIAGTLGPTSGYVKTKGRVAALLELGAGFHQEFTGRQNIWMNASLLGLSQQEIRAREESMIEFSELGAFIDSPIKTYSSGMIMRLAFSIATSVDPDILIIDEALSVGDQYFQKKCIDRMQSFKDTDKTILFCSHAMFTVNLLCRQAIWVDNGKIRKTGAATHVTAEYENITRERVSLESAKIPDFEPAPGTQEKGAAVSPLIIKDVWLNGTKDGLEIAHNSDLHIDIDYECSEDMVFSIAAGIRRNDELVCHVTSINKMSGDLLKGKGAGRVSLHYKSLPFFHGKFSVVAFGMDKANMHCFHQKASATFCMLPPDRWNNELGLLDLEHEWRIC